MRRNQGARNEATMSKSDHKQRTTFRENVIHVGAGFAAKERPHVLEALSTLASHLGRWDSRNVDVEVTLQDRGGKEQRVTLRTMLPGLPQLIAVAESPDITRALTEAKRELIRQLEHQKSAREPMNNRRLRRATIRRTAAFVQANSKTVRMPTPRISNSTSRPPMRADSGTAMTHITEPRVIGNHAEMGGSTEPASYIPLTVKDILRSGMRRRGRRREMAAAQSTWDSEGGAPQRT
jgi:ribosome-associated translation inhibitor RaiA